MIYLIHTELGYIKEAIQWSSGGGPSAPFGYKVSAIDIERAQLPNINSIYVDLDNGNLNYSIYKNLRVDREVISADGESEVTIFGLPEDSCELLIGTELKRVDDGTFKYKTTQLGAVKIRLVGKYTSNTLSVEALDIESIKSLFKAKVKDIKKKVEEQGARTPLGIIDIDELSLSKILINLQRVEEPDFIIDWRMKDNSVVPHNKQQFIELGKAASTFIDLTQSRKNSLDSIIEKCKKLGELERIPLELGWPR